MEDAHCAALDLLTPQGDDKKTHPSRLSFFGVFDGHGGDKVAQFAGKHIPDILLKQDTFKKGNYEQSLKDCFLATDRAILSGMHPLSISVPHCADEFANVHSDPQYEDEVSGCTACCGLISSDKIFIVRDYPSFGIRWRE